MNSENIFEVHNTWTQTESLVFHGPREEFKRIDDDHIIGQGDVVDEKIIVREETIEPSVSSDEQIIVQEEIMESEMEAFVDGLLQEVDVVCPGCEGTGRDYFHGDCRLCDSLGKLLDDGDDDHRGAEESETAYAIRDRKPERHGSTDTDWQKIRITLYSGSTVDVMPNDELCQV